MKQFLQGAVGMVLLRTLQKGVLLIRSPPLFLLGFTLAISSQMHLLALSYPWVMNVKEAATKKWNTISGTLKMSRFVIPYIYICLVDENLYTLRTPGLNLRGAQGWPSCHAAHNWQEQSVVERG